MANSEPVILFQRACSTHKKVTWHLLCLSGVLQCLECFLENHLGENFNRHPSVRR